MKQQSYNHNPSETVQLELSVIPVSSDKTPIRAWKEYQSVVAPIEYWYTHFTRGGTVGIITGKVSGNLEVIDVDVKNDPNGTIMDEFVGCIPNDLLKRLILQTTPNKGFHLIYRCPDVSIEGNQKLALHSDQAVIIETRGEGGYICHSSTKNSVLQGKLDLKNLDVEIPIITPEERDFLLEAARGLTRYFPSITDKDTTKKDKTFTYKEPAVNEFNEKYPIIELFEKHGWSVVNQDDEKVDLLRPGSTAAHSGYYFNDSKTFFCFSTSTAFTPEKPYNHFQILQALEGKNDYKTTLRLIAEKGYGVSVRQDRVSSDDIINYLNSIGVRYDSFIQDLTFNGRIIEEMDYNTIYIDMKNHFNREIPRSRYEENIKSNYITKINPVMDFINANLHRKPVGTFERWMDCIELTNKEIPRSVALHLLKKWYVGMIAQALDGEFPNEFFLTLISVEQGIGKTTMLRKYTLPKELQDYRVEHALSFDDDFKVIMGQSLLIIDDEMDGRTYEQEKTFKSILSTKEVTTRRKYDRRISKIKRRCSFAGSGNNLNVIREQQNRRIIPLEIANIHREMLPLIDYTDLFMEAYNLYAAGFIYSYQHEDQALLKQLNSDYVQKTDLDLLLDEYVQQPESDEDLGHISALDLVSTLSIHHPYLTKRMNAVTVGKLLNDRGIKTIRKGKNKTTGYEISKNSKILELIQFKNGEISL